MTTKQSSANPLRYTFLHNIKSSSLIPALGIFGALFITAVFSAANLFTTTEAYNDGGVSEIVKVASQYTYLFIDGADLVSGMFIKAAILIASVMMAICSFKFITDKRTVNVFYSLGTTRTTLFMGNYLSGAFLLVVSVLLPMLIAFFINLGACGFSNELLTAFLFILLNLTATALIAFSVSSAVFATVGTTFEATVFSGIVLLIPTIMINGLQMLMSSTLYGNPYGNVFTYANSENYTASNSLTDTLDFLVPIGFGDCDLFLFSAMDKEKKTNPTLMMSSSNDIVGSPDFLTSALWLFAAIAVMFLGIYFFKKRKAEICGFIGTNRVLNFVSTFALGFFICCIAIDPDDFYPSIALGMLGDVIVYIILKLILLRNTKVFAKTLYELPIQLLVTGTVIIIFATGLFGFSAKLPQKEDIVKAAVTFAGCNSEYSYCGEETYFSGVLNTVSGDALVDGFKSEKDIDTILALNQKAIDDKNEKGTHNVQFVYTLKNGKQFARDYTNITDEVYEELLALEQSDLYKERLKAIWVDDINKDPKTEDELFFANIQHTIREENGETVTFTSAYLNLEAEATLTAKEKTALANAIYKDLINRTTEEKYYGKTPLFYITYNEGYSSDFEVNGEDYGFATGEPFDTRTRLEGSNEKVSYYSKGLTTLFSSFTAYSAIPVVTVTEDMVNTVALVKSLGIYERLTEKPTFTSATVGTLKEAQKSHFTDMGEWGFDEDDFPPYSLSVSYGSFYAADEVYFDETDSVFYGSQNSKTYQRRDKALQAVSDTVVFFGIPAEDDYIVELSDADGNRYTGFIRAKDVPQSAK